MAGSGHGKKDNFEFKIITLCGSVRFKEKFWEAAKELMKREYLVLTPNFMNHIVSDELTKEQRKDLDAHHLKKIDISDAILVINCNGYIGEDTKSEIEYAKSKGKPVYYRYISCDADCYCIRNCVAEKRLPSVVRQMWPESKYAAPCPYYSEEDK